MRAILMKIKFMVHFHDSIWQMLSDDAEILGACDFDRNKTNRVFFHDSIWQMLSDDAEILGWV